MVETSLIVATGLTVFPGADPATSPGMLPVDKMAGARTCLPEKAFSIAANRSCQSPVNDAMRSSSYVARFQYFNSQIQRARGDGFVDVVDVQILAVFVDTPSGVA